MAAIAGQGVLHDRIRRSREQCDPGDGNATDRPGAAALPQRRFLSRPCRSSGNQRHPLRRRGCNQRADLGWAAQGVRPPRSGDHPADVDHRLAPASRGWGRLRDRPGLQAQGVVTVAFRRHHAVQFRRCVHQPCGGHRSVQHCRVLRVPAPADAVAVHLRRQRSRDQCANTDRVDRNVVRFATRTFDTSAVDGDDPVAVADVGHRGGGLGARQAQARVLASAHREVRRSRRHRCRGRLSQRRRDARRS